MSNNIHDKVFTCPKCHNKALIPIEPHKILGVFHGDIAICEECGAELQAITTYDYTVTYVDIPEEE